MPARHLEAQAPFTGSEWAAALEAVGSLMGTGAIVALLGKRGTGKTQIAVEVAREVYWREESRIDGMNATARAEGTWAGDKQVGDPCRYTTALEVFLRIRECYGQSATERERAAIAEFTKPRLLIIDEIQERGETPWEDRMLTYLIDKRYGAQLDTIIVGNITPEHLAQSLGASIASRIQETGTVIECNWESFRVREA